MLNIAARYELEFDRNVEKMGLSFVHVNSLLEEAEIVFSNVVNELSEVREFIFQIKAEFCAPSDLILIEGIITEGMVEVSSLKALG